jgi:hypothetical protein
MTEEEIKRQAEEWQRARRTEKRRRNQAEYRKKKSDDKWGGRIETLEVLHCQRFLRFLVGVGVLAEKDVKIKARINEATDALLSSGYKPELNLSLVGPPSLATGGGPCTVRVRMSGTAVAFLVEYATQREDFDWCEGCNRWNWCEDCDKVRAQFAQNLQSNRIKLKAVAEAWLYLSYAAWIPDNTRPCDCEHRLPDFCDNRCGRHPWGPTERVGLINRVAPPPPARPTAHTPPKRKVPGWKWDRGDDDPVIRSHSRSAEVGMRGRFAGTKERHIIPDAEYHPEADERASTRDSEETAREGEKALEKPFDDPTGTPKSWAIRSDVEPDDDKGATITPSPAKPNDEN